MVEPESMALAPASAFTSPFDSGYLHRVEYEYLYSNMLWRVLANLSCPYVIVVLADRSVDSDGRAYVCAREHLHCGT